MRKKVRKCHVGPDHYNYGTRTHEDLGVVLEGAISSRRVINYLDAFINALVRADLDRKTPEEIISKLKHLVTRLEAVVREERESRGS